jgi:DNA-binding transcriptional MocR family regulator
MSIQAVSWVLEESRSRGFARLVLLSLANYANDDDECWPSMRTIAKNAGISLGSVSKQIQELVDLGELEVVSKGSHRTSTRYRIQRSRDELSVQLVNSQRSRRELSVQRRGEQNHQEEEVDISSSSVQDMNAEFSAFLAKRAAEAVRDRKRKGLSVLSPGGLARSIQQDPEFVKESRELWEHRDCERCDGKGAIEEYSPGAGMTAVKCNA